MKKAYFILILLIFITSLLKAQLFVKSAEISLEINIPEMSEGFNHDLQVTFDHASSDNEIIFYFSVTPQIQNESLMKKVVTTGKQINLTTVLNKQILVPTGVGTFLDRLKIDGIDIDSSSTFEVNNSNVLFLRKLHILPGIYNYKLKKINKGGGTETVTEEELIFISGKNSHIIVKHSSILESIKKKYGNARSMLLSIILMLIITILGILKDKIKKLMLSIFDWIGRYSGGKLAENRFIKRYIRNIIFNHKYLKIIGFNTAGISRPLLEEVFVSLRISNYDTQFSNAFYQSQFKAKQQQTIHFNDAIREYQNLVILGSPGAGKTTTLSYTLLMFAQDKANQVFGVQEKLLPIFIPLRRLSNNTKKSILDDLQSDKSQIISDDILKEYPKNFFYKKLREGKCIILLDGLDEVTNEQAHHNVSVKINNLIADFPKNRYIVTCRIAGWKNMLNGFKIFETKDFSREEIQWFIRGWHKAIITSMEYTKLELDRPDKVDFKARWQEHEEKYVKPAIEFYSRRILNSIDSNSRIHSIAVNPMLLSLIALVHFNRNILPRGRTILYSQCVELLIDAWERTKNIASFNVATDVTQKETVLREIAYNFQVNGIGEDRRENIIKLVAEIAPKVNITIPAKELVQDDIEVRSGLLMERSIGVLGFSHLTLQEYLVAKHIQLNPSEYPKLAEHFENQEWREVILLYSGLVDNTTNLIKDIIKTKTVKRLILAGYCISDSVKYDQKTAQEIIDGLLEALKEADDDNIVNVLAIIATDYEKQALTVPQKLTKKMVGLLDSDASIRSKVITILGKTRASAGLKPIISFLSHEDEIIRNAAVTALINYGNVSLSFLKEYAQDEDQKIDISLLANILSGINSTSSAKLLMQLYSSENSADHPNISLQLAQMLRNPFIEIDLKEMSQENLPNYLRQFNSNENGWFHKDLTSKSGYNNLESKIRSDLYVLFTNAKYVTLSNASFKLWFPVLLKAIRTKQSLGTINNNALHGLGFDVTTNRDKFQVLIDQIHRSTMSLKFSLQNIHTRIKKEYLSSQSKSQDKIIKLFLFLFFLLNLVSAGIGIIRFGLESKSIFLGSIIFLVLIFSLNIFTCIKLNRSPFGWDGLFSLAHIFPNFLRAFPYLGKINIWIKWILFVGIFTIFSPFLWLLLNNNLNYIIADNLLIAIIPYLLFYYASFLVLKKSLFAQNHIYNLILLHSEGRKVL